MKKEVLAELKNVLKKRFIKKFSIKELKDEDTLKYIYAFAFSENDIIFFNAPARRCPRNYRFRG